jgi:hypothetical protein
MTPKRPYYPQRRRSDRVRAHVIAALKGREPTSDVLDEIVRGSVKVFGRQLTERDVHAAIRTQQAASFAERAKRTKAARAPKRISPSDAGANPPRPLSPPGPGAHFPGPGPS